jgi:hypothetical protein
MPERVVLVVRRGGMTPKKAYEVARAKLLEEGLIATGMNSYSLDTDKRTGMQTFMIRVEIEPPKSA